MKLRYRIAGSFLLLSTAALISLAITLSQRLITFRSDPHKQDLEFLASLMQEGKLRSVIDRRYTLNEVPAAIGYVESGRARGKVVIVVE